MFYLLGSRNILNNSKKNCVICDKKFYKTKSYGWKEWNNTRKTCSWDCRNKKLSITMKGKMPKNIKQIAGWNKGTKGLIKPNSGSFKKGSQSLDKHYQWKGGISFEPYPLGWNKTFKEQIRYRDRYKCQLCGKPEVENDKRLDVHHKDYNKNNINPDNLVSLCKNCHIKTNHNRDYWITLFEGAEIT